MFPLISTISISDLFPPLSSFFFFFNDTATTEIYTLSLHDALPISGQHLEARARIAPDQHVGRKLIRQLLVLEDRKSTRLNSSHLVISYAVFCLKKKKYMNQPPKRRRTVISHHHDHATRSVRLDQIH